VSDLDPRVTAILGFPNELLEYQRWLDQERTTATARDYLFSEERSRFEPRKDDVVAAMPGIAIEKLKRGVRLQANGAAIDIDGVSPKMAERIIGAIDGERCLLEVRWQAKVSAQDLSRFLRMTFGKLVFAPHAVASLEAALSGCEIVRFPAAPYCIERPYWENMIDVRRRFEARASSMDGVDSFVTLVRELHVTALLGDSLSSFYKPASPVADHTVAPGALFTAPPRLLESPHGTIFLDGPRVKVPLLGGEAYHRALYADLGDADALAPERSFEHDGVSWGRVVTARSERDDEQAAWFCPPRPIEHRHWERLHDLLNQGELARFHQCFVRLHPFHCANQSLAMNIVNAKLATGIPHLILDHLALRLNEDAYAEAFRRAIEAFAVSGDDPGQRLRTLSERKQRSFTAIQQLSSGDGAIDPDGARWALLRS
jgi:hypothetical protein